MSFKIVGDSCCDFMAKDMAKGYFVNVPLTLIIGDKEVKDDNTYTQEQLLKMISETDKAIRSACPSPDAFMEAYRGADEVYVVTLSSKLSGSYNSAMLAKQMYQEENPNVKIYVFDSKSAAAAQHLICEKIEEQALAGKSYETIVSFTEAYIQKQQTLFVLEDLDVMKKNGRMSKVKSVVASVLNIKPVLCGVDGEIQQLDQARSMNKALNKLLWHVKKGNYDVNRKVEITQCASRERCMNIRKVLVEQFGFKNVVILDAKGISTLYENRGGVIISL